MYTAVVDFLSDIETGADLLFFLRKTHNILNVLFMTGD